MPVRAVFEADSVSELHELLRTLGQAAELASHGAATPKAQVTPATAASTSQNPKMSYGEFKKLRPAPAQQILTVLEQAVGPVTLRSVEKQVGRSGTKMAGTLGALGHAAYGAFGAPIIIASPWRQLPDGTWDRDYTLNPAIYSGDKAE
jgi:hypothetical protein